MNRFILLFSLIILLYADILGDYFCRAKARGCNIADPPGLKAGVMEVL